MKYITRLLLLAFLAAFLALALPGQALAKDAADDKVVFGDTYRLGSGQTLQGNLAVLGGTATLEAGSQVNGDAALMGGTLDINGTITGNVSTLGGTLFLGDNAVVMGDVTMMGGTLHRSAGAQINGSLVNGGFQPFEFNFPTRPLGWVSNILAPIGNILAGLFFSILMAALAILVGLLWPRPTERVANSLTGQPAITGGLGLLTAIVAPALLVMLAITILLIPLSLLGFVVLGIAFLFGWIALGLAIGNKIVTLFKQAWNPALTAGLGTLVLGLVAAGIGWIPCVGWMVPVIAALLGLGGVVVTRFGTQMYPGTLSLAYAAPVTPAPPSAAYPAPVPPTQVSGEPKPAQPAEPPASGEDQNPTI